MTETTTREIAILRADQMVGSDFILPVMIKRVIGDNFPQTQYVYDLLREGGFSVEVKSVDLEAEIEIEYALQETFRDLLPSRPVFVDVATGRLYVTRSMGAGQEFLITQGDLFSAFGIALDGMSPEGLYRAVFTSKVRVLPVGVVRQARPELNVGEVRHAIDTGTPISMSRRDIARVLVAAIDVAAQRHRDITANKITGEFGAYTATTVIASCRFA